MDRLGRNRQGPLLSAGLPTFCDPGRRIAKLLKRPFPSADDESPAYKRNKQGPTSMEARTVSSSGRYVKPRAAAGRRAGDLRQDYSSRRQTEGNSPSFGDTAIPPRRGIDGQKASGWQSWSEEAGASGGHGKAGPGSPGFLLWRWEDELQPGFSFFRRNVHTEERPPGRYVSSTPPRYSCDRAQTTPCRAQAQQTAWRVVGEKAAVSPRCPCDSHSRLERSGISRRQPGQILRDTGSGEREALAPGPPVWR